MNENPQNERLRRYLLGALGSAEQEELEAEYFTDPARHDALLAAFDELAEDYLDGRLSPADATAFVRRVQASPWLRARAQTLHGVLTLAASEPASGWEAKPTGSAPRSFTDWFTRPLGWLRLPLLAWTAALSLLVLGAWLAVVWLRPRPDPRDRQVKTDVTPTPNVIAAVTLTPAVTPTPSRGIEKTEAVPKTVIATFFLIAPASRGATEAPSLPLPPRADAVRLRLELSPPIAPRYRARLLAADGTTLQRWAGLRARAGNALYVATLLVPTAKLAPGEYLIELQADAHRCCG